MDKKIKVIISTIVFFIMPFLVLAQQSEIKISADTITVQNGEILFAEGNVLVQNGNNKIKAKALKFDQISNKIEFTKIEDLYDGDSIKLSAEEAVISSDLSEGIIRAAHLLIDNAIKIQAKEVSLRDGKISSAKGISRVTSCEECQGKELNWYLTASSANRDVENSNIVYRNVTVRIKGLPIAYIPYLRMPDPAVDRARGFLVPEALITSNLATGLKLPYFIPMGMSSDILITPYFSTKTKTVEYRYRQKFRSGDLTVKGAFSDDDLVSDDLRYFSQLIGNFRLGYGIDLKFNAGKVGDKSYLGDYVYSEDSDLNSEVSLGKTVVQKQQFFDGNLSYLREKDQGTSLDEYYAFSGLYVRDISYSSLPGRLRLLANLSSSFNVKDDNSVSRPPSSAQVGLNYNQSNFLGPMRLSTDLIGNLNSFVNSADSGTTNEEFSLQYGALTSISAPQFKKQKGRITFFNPKISVSINGQENNILGNFFIGPDELSWGNIYSDKKIMSLTESETGMAVSFGFENQVFWETGQRVEISFAASRIGGLTYTSTGNSSLANEKFTYLSKFSYQTKHANVFSTNAIFSSEGQLLRNDLKGKFTYQKIDLEGHYEIIDQRYDSRLSQDLKTINFSSAYNFWDNFQVKADGRYDLTDDKMAKNTFGLGFSLGLWAYKLDQEYLKEVSEKLSLSAIYEDECTRLTFSFENRYQDVGSSAPVKSLMFRVQLKPFADVVFSQGGDQITF